MQCTSEDIFLPIPGPQPNKLCPDNGYKYDTMSQGNIHGAFSHTDFCGNWNPELSHMDRATIQSRSGYIIMFGGCPIYWASKLQTENRIDYTKAELIALSK